MAKLVQCVPNFSEGRDPEIIRALESAAAEIPGVALIDRSSDASHNRSVFTLVGNPQGIARAAFELCKVACEKIDMTKHSGEHPRMGATDVIPFVPVKDCSLAECVDLSKEVARRVWEELKIPSILYEESCSGEARRNLAAVRKGQFEGMEKKLLLDEWAPDFGER
ncbi:MAG: glutamate formiminotransferase, partial [Treponema sp.]|nr:glutamate formiminotransferase [Treponema sp.]